MIAHLSGTVAGVGLDGAVIEVGGVGLRVQCTPDTLAPLKPGEPARVATSLVVREDSLTLFGFGTDDERNVFELLQTRERHRPAAGAGDAGGALAGRAAPRGRGRGHQGAHHGPRHRQQGRAADHPRAQGPPRRAGRPRRRGNGAAPGPPGRAFLARPGHDGPGQPGLVRPRRRGRDRRGRGRRRRARRRTWPPRCRAALRRRAAGSSSRRSDRPRKTSPSVGDLSLGRGRGEPSSPGAERPATPTASSRRSPTATSG